MRRLLFIFSFSALQLFSLCAPAHAQQFTLTWTDNSTNETFWEVARSLDGETWVLLVSFPTMTGGATGVQQSYIDEGLARSTTYWYRVRAGNGAGYSAWSNTVSGTTPPPPQLPPDGAPDEPGLEYAEPGRLTNISTRGLAMVDDEPLIAGFVVTGGPVRVLLRGIGPTLAQFGVAGAMSDPRIQVIGGAGNDNWSGAEVAAAAAAVGAFALPAGSRDAALLLELPPGVYTVHLTGVGGARGVALIEVYHVP